MLIIIKGKSILTSIRETTYTLDSFFPTTLLLMLPKRGNELVKLFVYQLWKLCVVLGLNTKL